MKKINCWEYFKCGREPGGSKNAELGVCPVTINSDAEGLNGGTNGGRICWAVSGTFCNGKVQGTFANKRLSCLSCEFFKKVEKEEADNYKLLPPGQEYCGVKFEKKETEEES